jgi:AmiR/NasT family two-component response regulator
VTARVTPDAVVAAPAALAAAADACRVRPVPVVFAGDPDPAAVARAAGCEWVLGWAAGPAAGPLAAAVALAVRAADRLRAARAEAAERRRALDERKVVEWAKEAAARRCRVGEAEAYLRMRRLASGPNRKLAEVAARVLEAEAAFAELEAVDGRPRPAADGPAHLPGDARAE